MGTGKASSELYYGLFAIQHRGQNGAGMYVHDGEKGAMHKGPGLVGEVFNKSILNRLQGSNGLGHVRYPTIGSDVERDAQPFVISEPVEIAMVHNGNIVNVDQLAKKLECTLESECDLEVILALFSHELCKEDELTKDSVFSAVGRTMDRLNGSYSVVALIHGIGMLFFRDPHAIRPMVYGGKRTLDGVSYAVASENIVLDILGYEIIRDIRGGEAILVGEDKSIESRQIRSGSPRPCMFEWVYFARTDATIERKNVYETRLRLGKELAREWRKKKREIDVIVPVPDTARTYALAMSEELGVPFREGLLRNRYVGRTFIMPDQTSRETSVRTKLNPIIEEVKGKRVALVDDSIVRGTTSKKLVELMRKAGAKEVHFVIGCPPIISPCYYGIDMPTKHELKASQNSVNKICKDIGADTLTYQTIDGLIRGLQMDRNRLCTACLNEEYPTQVREDIREYFAIKREKDRVMVKAREEQIT